ncbi:MAG: response regulator, partial [Gemmatimonadota bacterium]|nr:response regulator [Gemmatimonadota bacterium]
PRVRANVIESLEDLGNRNVLGVLLKYKTDPDNRVRGNAIKALWNFGHSDVKKSLEDMLLDFKPRMRVSATWVIGEIGHHRPELKALLKVVGHDKDEMVKRNLELARRKIAGREEGFPVLLADDDEEFCNKLKRGLAADGYKSIVVHNGKAACEAALEQKPYLIMLDLRMPVMNGLEVLKALREKNETAGIPVIALCDNSTSFLIKKAVAAGANTYLTKPCSYEQVKRKMQGFV